MTNLQVSYKYWDDYFKQKHVPIKFKQKKIKKNGLNIIKYIKQIIKSI